MLPRTVAGGWKASPRGPRDGPNNALVRGGQITMMSPMFPLECMPEVSSIESPALEDSHYCLGQPRAYSVSRHIDSFATI